MATQKLVTCVNSKSIERWFAVAWATAFVLLAMVSANSVAAATGAVGDPPCSYDNALKANNMKGFLVRAFAVCGAGTTYPAPNSFLGATLVDACVPAVPLSSFVFGPKGRCMIKIKADVAENQQVGGGMANRCFPDDSQSSCNITMLKTKCQSA